MSDFTRSPGSAAPAISQSERLVIFASSLGTVFEWYDFYLYGSLAAVIRTNFFSALSPTGGFIAALIAFAAGFLVRPFGRWCSDGWAIWSAASTRSSSRS